ncbi:MAG: lytic transglycosylase domain-containing protein [Oceanococcus sp.]
MDSQLIKSGLAIVLLGLCSTAMAEGIRIYKQPDGSRLYTDQKKRGDQGYKYIGRYGRTTYKVSCAGYRPQVMNARRDRYSSLVQQYAEQYSVDSKLIEAVMRVESCLDRTAVSRAGARGLMQLMPGTAAELGVRDVFNPADNIRGGTLYLSKMLKSFGQDRHLALAAYNAGPGAVRRYSGIPPFKETQAYVKRVEKQYRRYGGAAELR